VRRTIAPIGSANEGGAKIEDIQSQIGRPRIFAAGNAGGDREMLEWAQANPRGGLAVLIDHDDADREFTCGDLGGQRAIRRSGRGGPGPTGGQPPRPHRP
jgi:hypothetical protein